MATIARVTLGAHFTRLQRMIIRDCYTRKKRKVEENMSADIRPQTGRESDKRFHTSPQQNFGIGKRIRSRRNMIRPIYKICWSGGNDKASTNASLHIIVTFHLLTEIIEGLLDSGTSKSIINGATLAAIVKLGRIYTSASPIVIETIGADLLQATGRRWQFLFYEV